MNIIKKNSPNFNDRKTNIDMLVLHYTDTKDIEESLYFLLKKEVSSHYLIDEDGTIYNLVNEDKRAWHAGISYWDGETDINSCSIGIEIQNDGVSHFPEKQMHAVIELCQDIIKRHNIPAHRILGHSDIAPSRKQDPGELFDWELLAKNGIGLWPESIKENEDNKKSLKEKFTEFGYNPKLSEIELTNTFKQHFIRDDKQDMNQAIQQLNKLKKLKR